MKGVTVTQQWCNCMQVNANTNVFFWYTCPQFIIYSKWEQIQWLSVSHSHSCRCQTQLLTIHFCFLESEKTQQWLFFTKSQTGWLQRFWAACFLTLFSLLTTILLKTLISCEQKEAKHNFGKSYVVNGFCWGFVKSPSECVSRLNGMKTDSKMRQTLTNKQWQPERQVLQEVRKGKSEGKSIQKLLKYFIYTCNIYHG